ncbi:MAG: HtrA protease/chaperone protein [Verrucomicrobiales bacterium]|nr:HtrA protease/chaperone protein [Verrucomicrobiales bacterium]
MNCLSRALLPVLLLAAPVAAVHAEEVIGPFRNSLTVDRTLLDRNAPMMKSYAGMLEKVQPSVVTVFTGFQAPERPARVSQDEAALRFFFGLPPAAPQPRRSESKNKDRWQQLGLGTGVIVTKDGYILTNKHVVMPPDLNINPGLLEYRVSIPGNDQPLTAKIVDFSFDKDIAVLKVSGSDLPAATLADSSQVKVGDVAFALGAPFGIDKTVTMGIISAKRNDEVLKGMEKQELLQTDASINPGNSGGPLVDAEGRVIGINTAIYANQGGGNMGIGFAIPINNAVAAADALSRPRGYLGVGLSPVTNLQAAAYYGLKGGAIVENVEKGTPGARAGLQPQDVIFAIDDREIVNDDELRREISQATPGKTVTLHIMRDETKTTVRVTLGERPNRFIESKSAETGASLAGMKVAPLSEEDRKQYKLESGGLVVTSVEPNTPAATSGLQNGDIIELINGRQPATAAEAIEALGTSTNGSSALHIRRGSAKRLFLLDTPGK